MAKKDPELEPLSQGLMDGFYRMEEVVNNMLDVSKIDSNTLDISPVDSKISFIIARAMKPFKSAIKERSLELTSEGLDNLPNIQGDTELLHKVFYHVIMNAIKYTPDGGKIAIQGQTIVADSRSPEVEISVHDNGIGIARENQEVVFEKFYQTGEVLMHSSGKTKFKGGGPGLGLAIARGIVIAHGGKIWLDSPGYDEKTFPGYNRLRQAAGQWAQNMTDQEDTRRKSRRDLLLVLLILPLGVLCMFATGQAAISLAPDWVLNADMRSLLDPNAQFSAGGNQLFIEPLEPGILTLPAWGEFFLTPNASIPTRLISTATPPPPNTPPPPPPVRNTPVDEPDPTATVSGPIIIPTNVGPLQADLIIQLSDNNSTYTPGTLINYTILVSNLGPDNALRFDILDNIPVVITGLSVNCTPATLCGQEYKQWEHSFFHRGKPALWQFKPNHNFSQRDSDFRGYRGFIKHSTDCCSKQCQVWRSKPVQQYRNRYEQATIRL